MVRNVEPVRFRARFTPRGRLHVEVLVFPTRRAFARHCREQTHLPAERTCHGRSYAFVHPDPTRPGCVGEIVLIDGFLSGRILSHEAAHAVFGWLRWRGLAATAPCGESRVSDVEERFCYAVGDLMRHMLIGLEDRGLLPS